jgi:two-component system, NarL family, sensor histidine kinase UhpB
VDTEGHITRYSERFAQMWGLPADVIASGNDRQAQAFVLSQLRDPEAFLRKVQELYARPEAESVDVLAFKDGRVFERYSRPQRVEGRVTGRVWSFRDVTDRLRAEANLAHERDLLQALMDNIPDTIYFKDTQSRFTRINRAQARVLGVTDPEHAIGKTDADFQPQHLAQDFMAEEQQIVQGGKPIIDRVEFNPTLEGQPRWFSATKAPFRDPVGRVIGLVGISRDITARMQIEETLQRSHEQLQALTERLQSIREEERARFAYTLHDQLGQELSSLKMDVGWFQRNLGQADVASLAKKAQDMGALLDSCIQTVRRMTTELRPSLLDDFGLAAAIEWQLREFEAQSGIESSLIHDGETLWLDREASTALFRIFQDLLANVRQHAQATRVEVELSQQFDQVTLQVHDNGRGISTGELNSSQSLGLRAMRERIHRLNGSLEVRGKRGEGTLVRITVRAQAESPEAE